MLGRHLAAALRPTLTRLPFRTAIVQQSTTLGARSQAAIVPRSYATAAAAETAEAKPKRAVKKASTGTRAAPKSSAVKAKTAKKPKAAAKKKKKAPAKAPKKKVLTEAQKARNAAKLADAKRIQLKKAALRPPMNRRKLTAFNAYVQENHKASTFESNLAQLSQQFKNLSPAEREEYNRLSIEKTQQRHAEYKRWVESHTIEEIKVANQARAQIRRKNYPLVGNMSPIKDERVPKGAATPYALFVVDRHASGEFTGISLVERSKLIGAEWKALDSSEKQKYQALHDRAAAAAA